MVRRLLLVLLIIGIMIAVSHATEDETLPAPYPVAAYAEDGGLYIFYLQDEPLLIAENPVGDILWQSYAAPVWSPDGQVLAYQSPDSTHQMYHVSMDDLTPQPLLAAADFGTVLTFTLDSQSVIYATFDEWVDANNPVGIEHGTWQQTNLILEQAFLQPDTPHRVIPDSTLATIHEIDLAIGSPFCPNHIISEIESRKIYAQPQFLADTTHGTVGYYGWMSPDTQHTLHIGASSLDVPAMSNVVLSVDNHAIAFIEQNENRIGIVNLVEETVETFEIGQQPEAIAWNGGRYIYYAVQIEGSESLIPDEYWELQQFWYPTACGTINQVAIYQFDTETGASALIYQDNQYTVPWMELSPDGTQLYFSAIPNGEAWRNHMLEDDCKLGDCAEYVLPNLYRLHTSTMQAELLLERVLKSSVNFASPLH